VINKTVIMDARRPNSATNTTTLLQPTAECCTVGALYHTGCVYTDYDA